MSIADIRRQEISEPLSGGEFVLDASIDPLELAAQALAKLKQAGLPGYLEPLQPEIPEAEPASNIVHIFKREELEQKNFELIYLKESKKVRSLAARIVGIDKAEDIVSETFFKAWNNRDKFVDQGAGMRPWLLRIAYNLCMDVKRGEGHFIETDPELVLPLIADKKNDYEEFEGRLAAEDLLATTTQEQRDAMFAVYVEGTSFEDYAEQAGKSYNGTKSLVHRGKANVLKNMKGSIKVQIAEILSPSERANLTPRQQELFAKFLPLVEGIARKIAKGYDEPIEDFISDGYVGLFKAVQGYNPDKVRDQATNGTGYISATIFGSILHGMRSWYGRDTSMGGKVTRLKPSVLGGTSASLEAPLTDGDEPWTLGDTLSVSDQETIDYEVLKERVFTEASDYSDRDKEILVRRLLLDQTQSQIATEVGISQMHVSRLLERMSQDLGSKIGY